MSISVGYYATALFAGRFKSRLEGWLVLATFLFFGGAASLGSAEPGRAEDPPAVEAMASTDSTSSDSSSGTIMITMTGMTGCPGDLGP